jgi:hypothetical protein
LRQVHLPPRPQGRSIGRLALVVVLPHLPQRQIDALLSFAAVHRWPPPFTQVPASGLLLLHVVFPHFVHFQFPIIFLLALHYLVLITQKTLYNGPLNSQSYWLTILSLVRSGSAPLVGDDSAHRSLFQIPLQLGQELLTVFCGAAAGSPAW